MRRFFHAAFEGSCMLSALRFSRRCSAFLLAITLLCFLGGASALFAQVPTWTSIGPEGGTIFGLAIDPTTPTTLYAGTFGGVVFKSADGGSSWSAVTDLTGKSVLALAIDPTTPTTLYAGTEGGGVFKSIDGGGNWSAANMGLTSTTLHQAPDQTPFRSFPLRNKTR